MLFINESHCHRHHKPDRNKAARWSQQQGGNSALRPGPEIEMKMQQAKLSSWDQFCSGTRTELSWQHPLITHRENCSKNRAAEQGRSFPPLLGTGEPMSGLEVPLFGCSHPHSYNAMIFSFGLITEMQHCHRAQQTARGTTQGPRPGSKCGKRRRKKKKAQECTTENTVLINRVNSHRMTRTEHMGSARSRSHSTGGQSGPGSQHGLGGSQHSSGGSQHGRSPV